MTGATEPIRAAELIALSLATDLGTGHVTYAERPDEFENAVRVFAAELDRRTTTAST